MKTKNMDTHSKIQAMMLPEYKTSKQGLKVLVLFIKHEKDSVIVLTAKFFR